MKYTTLLFVFIACTLQSIAQPFTGTVSVNRNNISAPILLHGDMWWNPATQVSNTFYPQTTTKTIAFSGGVWMSGYDNNNQLHVSAQTYRQSGNDYWPGPLDANDTLTHVASNDWATFWKIDDTDITHFLATTPHTASNTPLAILHWPAKGNPNAAGNLGATLTITDDMAPFVDVNGDGHYNALDGDYPVMKGNQMVFYVFSDNGSTHNNTNGSPLKAEIHATSYAFSRGTLIDNVVYYEYDIVNKSSVDYHNMRVGVDADLDLGYDKDDFVGFDSAHRMGINYNGVTNDGQSAGVNYSYGTNMPVIGVTMIHSPEDVATTLAPTGSFIYYNNDFTITGNPVTAAEYSYYLRQSKRDGSAFPNAFLSDVATECINSDTPGDRRFVISTGDFSFTAGSTHKLVFALLATPLGTNNACPNFSFPGIKTVADTAWQAYHTLGVANTSAPAISADVYPNPAQGTLHITTHTQDISFRVLNILGTAFLQGTLTNGNNDITIDNIPAGIYLLELSDKTDRKVMRIIKQ